MKLIVKQLNYKKIADMYGEGATYDAIEGRFRGIRKEAEKLKVEIESGQRAPAPSRGTGEKRSPRKPRRQHSVIDLDSVESGRITKSALSASSSPSKRRNAAQIKKEMLEASASTSSSGDAAMNSSGDEYMPAGVVDPGYSFDTPVIDDPIMYTSFDLPGQNTTTNMTMDGGEQWVDEFDEPLQYA